MDIILKDIPELQKKYQFYFKKYDIDISENMALLEKMEEKVLNKGEDLPIIFIGDSVFYGPKNIHNKLENVLENLSKQFKPTNRDTVKALTDSALAVVGEINLYYFYQPGCRECSRAEILLNSCQKSYDKLKVYRFNIFEDSSKMFYEALAETRHVPQAKRLIAPAIFIGDDYLIKEQITSKGLDLLIEKYKAGSTKLDTLSLELGGNQILQRFYKFSIFGILLAGLLDGLNPCAFATLIFFVSYLLVIGRQRRDIILMAIFFILSIFVVYFAIGFGAYKLINYLSQFSIAAKLIFAGFGLLAIALGILSFRDYLLARRGDFNRMILQLPQVIKQRIYRDIQQKTAVGGIIFGSLVAGLFISFLEFACTGQVYLPTITFMTSRAGLSLRPFLALLAYNIMFIMPLIVIAVLATIIATEKIYRSFTAKVPLIKLLTAILFLGLGSLLLILA